MSIVLVLMVDLLNKKKPNQIALPSYKYIKLHTDFEDTLYMNRYGDIAQI